MLQSWEYDSGPLETEGALELVDTDTTGLAFLRQHAKRGQATQDVMRLSPLRACLTAGQPEVILTHPDDFLKVGADTIQSTDLGSQSRQAMGGTILGAVSDDQDVPTARQPAGRCPVGMAPIGPKRLTIEPAMLFEVADTIPAVVPKAIQQGFGGIPRLKEHGRRATAEAVAGVAQQR